MPSVNCLSILAKYQTIVKKVRNNCIVNVRILTGHYITKHVHMLNQNNAKLYIMS